VIVTKDQLETLYVGQGLTVRQCAEALGLPTHGCVSWRLKKFGIAARPAGFQAGHRTPGNRHQENSGGWRGGKKPIPCTYCGAELLRFPSLIRENNFCNKSCKGGYKRQDLTGQKFGMLTIIAQGERDRTNHIQWQSRCDCGNERLVRTGDLLSGRVKSCGCKAHKKGEQNHSWKGGKIEIACANPVCDKTKWIYPARKQLYEKIYCTQECHGEHVTAMGSRKGNNSGRYVERQEVQCAFCEAPLNRLPSRVVQYKKQFCDTTCSAKWRSKNQVGPESPSWKGGLSFLPYPTTWTFRLREAIRGRDDRQCRICGLPEAENGERLAVHHIDYNKENIEPENLAAVCHDCHCLTNFSREQWKTFFAKQNVSLKTGTDD